MKKLFPSKLRKALTAGDAVRIARELMDMSQVDLAGRCGIPQSTISAIESNKVSLGVERARKLAIALNVHPGVLLFPQWGQDELMTPKAG